MERRVPEDDCFRFFHRTLTPGSYPPRPGYAAEDERLRRWMLVAIETYESGHMMYIDEPSLAKMKADMAAFVERALGHSANQRNATYCPKESSVDRRETRRDASHKGEATS